MEVGLCRKQFCLFLSLLDDSNTYRVDNGQLLGGSDCSLLNTEEERERMQGVITGQSVDAMIPLHSCIVRVKVFIEMIFLSNVSK